MVQFLKEIVFSLSELETVGICHRDIKPANFIVTEDDKKIEKIKLIDFEDSTFKVVG